jgi:cytochrome b561
MGELDNTRERYGSIAVAFHWLMAVLVVGLLALGLYMVQLPDVGYDKKKITLILWHKEYGILALLFVLARMAWRSRGLLPRLEPAPVWQKVTARFVHLCLYALLVALPITGWLMSSASALPVPFFGLGYLPEPLPRDDYLFRAFIAIHKWLAYALLALLAAHVGAALWHHFVDRDATLKKMLPD